MVANCTNVFCNEHTDASVSCVIADKPRFLIAPCKPRETEYIAINAF